jgi:6-pyruvoyl-tetrahydropterin synthase
MAKGTSVSSVNFSIPEGADPMGIGIPDLGRSSYDPIESIRNGWETARQDRLIKSQERREDWKAQKAEIPTYQNFNRKVAGKLNQKAVKIGEYVDQQYRAGQFWPFARTKDGSKTYQKLEQAKGELADEGEAFNNILLPAYKNALDIINDPKNEKLLDQDYTKAQMKKFTETDDIEEMMRLKDKLYAFKPTAVNMAREVKSRLNDYLPEETIKEVDRVFDPLTGKIEITETTGIDRAELERAMLKVYDDMKFDNDENINYINRAYKNAPKSDKVTDDGVPIDEKAWFVGRYVPGYADKIKTSFVAKSDDGGGFDWKSLFGGVSFDNGSLVMGSPTVKSLTRTRTRKSQTNSGTRRNPVYEDEEYKTNEQYYAYTVNLQGVIDKPFAVESSTDTYNQQSGERIPAGMVAYEQPTNVSMMPIAKDNSVVTMPDGETIAVKKGEPIRKEVYDQMQKDKSLDNVYWDWFVTSASSIKKTTDDQTEAVRNPLYGDDYIPTHMITTIRPWNDAKKAILTETAGKFDLSEMANAMEQMKKEKNNVGTDILQQLKDKKDEEVYEELF